MSPFFLMRNTISSPCNAIEHFILPKVPWQNSHRKHLSRKDLGQHAPPLLSYRKISRACIQSHSHHKTENTDRLDVQGMVPAQVNQQSSPEKRSGKCETLENRFQFLLYISFMLCKSSTSCSKPHQYFWISASAARAKVLEWKTIKVGFQDCVIV